MICELGLEFVICEFDLEFVSTVCRLDLELFRQCGVFGGGAFCLFFSLVCRHRLMTPIIIFTPPQPRPHPNEKRKLFKRTVIIIICIYYVLLYIIHVNILKQLTRSVLTR